MRLPHPLLPSPGAWLWLVAFVVVLLDGPGVLTSDSDLAVHLAYGRVFLDRGGVPELEPLLYTVGSEVPFVVQEWLYEVLLAVLDAILGLAGPLLLTAGLVATATWGVHQGLRRRGVGVWPATLGALLGLVGAVVHLHARPHVVSWLLVIVLWAWLDRLRRGGGLVMAIVGGAALFGAWANLHGGFVLGLILVGVFGMGAAVDAARGTLAWDRIGVLALGGVAGVLGTLANPWGPWLHAHLVGFLSDRYVLSRTADFAASSWGDGSAVLLLGISAVLVGAALPGWRRRSLADLLVLVALVVGAWGTQRNLPFLALVGPLAVGPGLARWMAARHDGWIEAVRASSERLDALDRPSAGWAWMAVAAVGALVGHAWLPAHPDRTVVPVEALRAVTAEPVLHGQRPYTDFVSGGFVLAFTPVSRVSLHALNANYPSDLLRTFEGVDRARPGWHDVLDDWQVGWTFQQADRGLVDALDAHPCWSRWYADDQAVVHRRVTDCAADPHGSR